MQRPGRCCTRSPLTPNLAYDYVEKRALVPPSRQRRGKKRQGSVPPALSPDLQAAIFIPTATPKTILIWRRKARPLLPAHIVNLMPRLGFAMPSLPVSQYNQDYQLQTHLHSFPSANFLDTFYLEFILQWKKNVPLPLCILHSIQRETKFNQHSALSAQYTSWFGHTLMNSPYPQDNSFDRNEWLLQRHHYRRCAVQVPGTYHLGIFPRFTQPL